MSVRDQRVGTGHSDKVEEVQYFTSGGSRVPHVVATNSYTFRYERSDELGGMAVIELCRG